MISLRLPLVLILASALPMTACETLQGATGGDVTNTLQTVATLSGEVSTWSKALGEGNVTDAALTKLGGYSDQFGNLGTALNAAISAVAPEQKDQLTAIVGALQGLGGKSEDNLKQLDPSQRQTATKKFSMDSASVGQLVTTALQSMDANKGS